MKKMSIYEPALCGETSLCGVNVDPELLRITTVLNNLKNKGIIIERYNLNSTPNVTFEPGCRNNWHIHHKGGQILLVTAGRGYYQEWGREARELKPGDVVQIPPEVKHWHGAAPDSWFAHLAVEVPAPGASNEWLEPVSQQEYGKLK